MFKNIGKNISKSLSSKCSQKPLHHTKKSEQFREKIESNRIKKQLKQLEISLVIKSLMELRKSQEVHHRIIQKQLKISMTKKYLKKDIISTRKVENY